MTGVDVVDEAARREAKRQRKQEQDLRRRLDSWELYRALWDGIDLKRQLVGVSDKKARFALVIMGALNAAVYVVLVRGSVMERMPAGMKPWFVGVAALYGLATFLFVVQTISALRPSPEARMRAHDELKAHGVRESLPIGLFFPLDGVVPTLEEELGRWNGVCVHHVSTELVAINRGISATLERQFTALQAVYRGLKVLVVLAAVLIAMVGVGFLG